MMKCLGDFSNEKNDMKSVEEDRARSLHDQVTAICSRSNNMEKELIKTKKLMKLQAMRM
jgi:hypothetical protein